MLDPGAHVRRYVRRRAGDSNDNNGRAGVSLIVLVVSLVVYAVSFLLTRSLSRYRELSADRSGALLTGKPSALASALPKSSGEIAAIPDRDLRQVETVQRARVRAGPDKQASLATLFSTHPPLEKRLEQLAKISAQLGQR